MELSSITTWALPAVAAICVCLMFVFASLGLMRMAKKTPEQENFDKFIDEISGVEVDDQVKPEIEIDTKNWWGYWHKLYLNTGTAPKNPNDPGNWAIVGALLVLGVGALVWPRDILAGFGFALGGLFVMRLYFNFLVKKRIKTLEKQLPLLIASMRANLQANATPQASLVASVDEVPEPLKDELLKLKKDLAFNVPLNQALSNLAERVPSREMKFLISSIEIAIDSGTNPGPQLEVIQGIIDQRTRIRQKLEAAVAEVQPALLVSGLTIPASFIFSIYSSNENRDFWVSFYGLIAAGVVAALYAIGMFISKKLVDGVENT